MEKFETLNFCARLKKYRIENLSMRKRQVVMNHPKHFNLKLNELKYNDSYLKKLIDFFEAPFIKFFYSLVKKKLLFYNYIYWNILIFI